MRQVQARVDLIEGRKELIKFTSRFFSKILQQLNSQDPANEKKLLRVFFKKLVVCLVLNSELVANLIGFLTHFKYESEVKTLFDPINKYIEEVWKMGGNKVEVKITSLVQRAAKSPVKNARLWNITSKTLGFSN